MLFDAKFFEIAASAFPNLTFHIIGGGKQAEALRGPNVFVLGETPFDETRAYIAHADAGIAAYRGDKVAPYLADTSLKLMQFGAYGLPSVCPYIAVGDHEGRFGYQPGNRPSIVSAIRAALAHGRFAGKVPPTWAEVTRQILNPSAYVAPSIAAGAEQDYGSNDLQIPA
jgi:2-beta-glucuronyltransferase